jgi:hypothetical protein
MQSRSNLITATKSVQLSVCQDREIRKRRTPARKIRGTKINPVVLRSMIYYMCGPSHSIIGTLNENSVGVHRMLVMEVDSPKLSSYQGLVNMTSRRAKRCSSVRSKGTQNIKA